MEISKNSFYGDGRAFQESEPPKKCLEGSICCCTRYVAKKPTEAPNSVCFSLRHDLPERNGYIHNGEGFISVRLSTFSEDKIDKERDRVWITLKLPYNEHIYCYLLKNQIGFEYYIPGYGFVDYIFPKIYRGNDIDRSRFFNGHSPPTIDTTVSDERQLWTYACSWGKESMRLLHSRLDIDCLFLGSEYIFMALETIDIRSDDTPKTIHDAISNSGLLKTFADVETILRNFDLPNHPLFADFRAVDEATKNA